MTISPRTREAVGDFGRDALDNPRPNADNGPRVSEIAMPIFRKGQGKNSLAAAMAAVKMGDRCLQVGCTDGSLLAAIISKAGLSGRACSVVESEADADRARTGAAQSGTLLGSGGLAFTRLPYPDASFDVVVVDSLKGLIASATSEDRAACLGEVRRVLAPRGRVNRDRAGVTARIRRAVLARRPSIPATAPRAARPRRCVPWVRRGPDPWPNGRACSSSRASGSVLLTGHPVSRPEHNASGQPLAAP